MRFLGFLSRRLFECLHQLAPPTCIFLTPDALPAIGAWGEHILYSISSTRRNRVRCMDFDCFSHLVQLCQRTTALTGAETARPSLQDRAFVCQSEIDGL